MSDAAHRHGGTAILIAVLAMAPFLGCSTGTQSKINSATIDSYSVQTLRTQETKEFNQKLLSSANVNVDPSDYLLGAGDLIQVTVFESEELNTKVRVSSRGYITLPLLGQVEVKGLSARETEVLIENLYREKYIKNPHISVFVEEHFSQRVTLMGQFKTPGTYDYLSKMRLLDVMALAGGLSDSAGRTAQIRRIGTGEEDSGTILVDLDKLIREGHSDLNVQINGGDVVFVPEAGMFFVDGAVRKPGAYHIKQRTILLEAISVAGGLAPYADPDSIILIRHLGDGERQVLELDLADVKVQETSISDRDIILVKVSPVGQLVQGLGINIGVPGLGFGYRDPVR
jgi:polysaccharide export outer membrane protein